LNDLSQNKIKSHDLLLFLIVHIIMKMISLPYTNLMYDWNFVYCWYIMNNYNEYFSPKIDCDQYLHLK
jgi:hypothetical protein